MMLSLKALLICTLFSQDILVNAQTVPTAQPTLRPTGISSCLSVGFPFNGQTITFAKYFDLTLKKAIELTFPSYNIMSARASPITTVTCPSLFEYDYSLGTYSYNQTYLSFRIKIDETTFSRDTDFEQIFFTALKSQLIKGVFGKNMYQAAVATMTADPLTPADLYDTAAVLAYNAIMNVTSFHFESLTATFAPTVFPTRGPIKYDRTYSDLSVEDSGAVIGAVAGFGACVLGAICYLVYSASDSGDHSVPGAAAATSDDAALLAAAH